MPTKHMIILGIVIVAVIAGVFAYTQIKSASLDESLNKKVILYGKAEDAKGGAVIRPEGSGYPHSVSIEVVYIENLDFWPEDLVGQTVQVEGVLRKKKYIPNGEQYVLERATWKII